MVFNIAQFKARGLVYGGARPALFSVSVTPPPAADIKQASVTKFTFTARAASLPESNIDSIQVPYFGRKIKIAGDRTFADWRVTVMNDEDFGVRSMFEKWSNAMNKHVNNTRLSALSFENYKSTMEVVQYGKDGQEIRSYQIIGAFPTVIDAIELDWDTTNAVETFNVGFAYDYWIPYTEISPGKSDGGINEYRGATQTSD